MTGILYLCATPIGNLGDMTPRVVETLRSVDLIAAEDTRNSLKLMTHFEIHTPMTSYHEYNKVEKAYTLIAKLQEGQNIALITDAGTPAISDPGEVLVRMCLEAGPGDEPAGAAHASRRSRCRGFRPDGFALKVLCRRIKKSAPKSWRIAGKRAGR